jgi:heme/copper-type cytochrome/quinol oxidase subunit 4
MGSLPLLKKQILILFVFSLLATIASIIHGIFFDLDFSQIKRLTFEGFLLTLFVIFPAILFLEWVFDFNNKNKFDELEKKIKKLKK